MGDKMSSLRDKMSPPRDKMSPLPVKSDESLFEREQTLKISKIFPFFP